MMVSRKTPLFVPAGDPNAPAGGWGSESAHTTGGRSRANSMTTWPAASSTTLAHESGSFGSTLDSSAYPPPAGWRNTRVRRGEVIDKASWHHRHRRLSAILTQ